jgi:hypothetical protein
VRGSYFQKPAPVRSDTLEYYCVELASTFATRVVYVEVESRAIPG